jgi:hypothetical protein
MARRDDLLTQPGLQLKLPSIRLQVFDHLQT